MADADVGDDDAWVVGLDPAQRVARIGMGFDLDSGYGEGVDQRVAQRIVVDGGTF